MDSFIAMGTAAAWIYSTIILLFPNHFPAIAQHAYFDTALLVMAFINLGAALELKARGNTSQAINKLMNLQPKTANVLRDGEMLVVPLEEINVNQVSKFQLMAL